MCSQWWIMPDDFDLDAVKDADYLPYKVYDEAADISPEEWDRLVSSVSPHNATR